MSEEQTNAPAVASNKTIEDAINFAQNVMEGSGDEPIEVPKRVIRNMYNEIEEFRIKNKKAKKQSGGLGNVATEPLVKLAQQAASISFNTFEVPEELVGLPQIIPFGSTHGTNPAFIHLRDYAEKYRLFPERKKGVAQALTLQSFIDLTNRAKTKHSAIFGDNDYRHPNLTAIIDYNHAEANGGRADNGQHRVVFNFPTTQDFDTWMSNAVSVKSQELFANFIEQMMPTLVAPTPQEAEDAASFFNIALATPAKMVELSTGLDVRVDSRVAKRVNLQNGVTEIHYSEEHKGENAAPLKVPSGFMFEVEPFKGSAPVRFLARLRYQIKNSATLWSYDLIRAEDIVTAQLEKDFAAVSEQTGLPVYYGTPEMRDSL